MNLFLRNYGKITAVFYSISLLLNACGGDRLNSHPQAEVKQVLWSGDYASVQLPNSRYSVSPNLKVSVITNLLDADFCNAKCVKTVSQVFDVGALDTKPLIKEYLNNKVQQRSSEFFQVIHSDANLIKEFVSLLNNVSLKPVNVKSADKEIMVTIYND